MKKCGCEAAWGSHLPILFRCLERSRGPVLECGVGQWSTPFLHVYCESEGRELYSFDHDPQWYWTYKKYETDLHHVGLVKDWREVGVIDTMCWGVALLDHGPTWGQRRREARRLVNNCEYVVLHDSHPSRDKYFRYGGIYPLFKYRFTYDRWSSWSTVVSNLRELSDLCLT